MKHRKLLTYFLPVALLLFAGTAVAQHSQQHDPQMQQGQMSGPMMMHQGMHQGTMMNNGMMSGPMMMQTAVSQDEELQDLVDQLTQNLTDLQPESAPAGLKKKLAQQRSLLEQLRNKMKERHQTMQQMNQYMQHCQGMASGDAQPSS
jgi:hypothetical protein